MDEIVIRAIARWPNVPSVYGWLRLDRRGQWWIKSGLAKGRAAREGAPAFERIGNAAVIEFIGRNYAHDERGSFFFQNGPQRVFVALDYTPRVYRLDDAGAGLVTHAGEVPAEVRAAYLDEAGALLIETDLGVGVLLDRDLQPLLAHLRGEHDESAEALLDAVAHGHQAHGRLFGRPLAIAAIRAGEVATRFGFDPDPRPAPGEPEC